MFDNVAKTYDNDFTHTLIGGAQRSYVLSYLEKMLPATPLRVLELNCGTGEDALWFARKGHRVVAMDISETMINVAREKLKNENAGLQLQFHVMDNRDLAKWDNKEKFDLVFSDFGGLNCLSREDLISLASDLSDRLVPQGHFVAVVMGKWCFMESAYFMAKFKFNEMFRRNTSQPLHIMVGFEEVKTWYYHPGEFMGLFAPYFQKECQIPVGLFVPPSYLEPYFKKKPGSLRRLVKVDDMLNPIPSLAYLSDHFLMDFQKLGN